MPADGGDTARLLSGRVAWITGAGTGMGRAIALTLARAGATVALTGRSPAPLAETEAMARAEGVGVVVAPADVGDKEQVASAHRSIVAALGDPAILINNAGLNIRQRHWGELTPESTEQMIGTNLTGPFLCTLAVLPAMRARRDGVLVHIASVSATGIFIVSGPSYTASKHGVRAMSATLNAEEGIHGIRSICINPGEVVTPLLAKRPTPPTAEQMALMVQPEDVAASVLFCATLPPRTCITELTIAPTDNNFYRAEANAVASKH